MDVTGPSHDEVKQSERPKLRDVMGPGLITGASDDDPSGIATYSQAGAQFGYGLGWTLLLTYPLMCAIQLISAHIGRVTGRGLGGNLRRHYPGSLLYLLIGLLVVANTINLGADLGASNAQPCVCLVEQSDAGLRGRLRPLITVLLEVFIRYSRYVVRAATGWPSLSSHTWPPCSWSAYPGSTVARNLGATTRPLSGDHLTVIVAVFGTTIGPYSSSGKLGRGRRRRKIPTSQAVDRRSPASATSNGSHAARHDRRRWASPASSRFSSCLTTAATLNAHSDHRHPDILPGSRSAAPDSRPVCFLQSSPWVSSARGCWHYRCWPAVPPMRSARRCNGGSDWPSVPAARAPSTARSQPRPLWVRRPFHVKLHGSVLHAMSWCLIGRSQTVSAPPQFAFTACIARKVIPRARPAVCCVQYAVSITDIAAIFRIART